MSDGRDEYDEYLKKVAMMRAVEEWEEPLLGTQDAEASGGAGLGIIGFLVVFYVLDKAISFLIKVEMVIRSYFRELMLFLNHAYMSVHLLFDKVVLWLGKF